MHLKAYAKTHLRVENGKGSTIEKHESWHSTPVMPIRGVKNINVKQHLPDHGCFITLLLSENPIERSLGKSQKQFVNGIKPWMESNSSLA